VGDAAGELPDGLHLLCLAQLRLESTSLGDVFDEHLEALQLADLVVYRPAAQVHGDHAAVLALPRHVHSLDPSAPAILRHEARPLIRVGVDVALHTHLGQLCLRLVTQNLHEGRVHGEEASLGAGAIDAVVGVLDERAVVRLRPDQGVLHPLALGDVPREGHGIL
jgi:hypothetical protein